MSPQHPPPSRFQSKPGNAHCPCRGKMCFRLLMFPVLVPLVRRSNHPGSSERCRRARQQGRTERLGGSVLHRAAAPDPRPKIRHPTLRAACGRPIYAVLEAALEVSTTNAQEECIQRKKQHWFISRRLLWTAGESRVHLPEEPRASGSREKAATGRGRGGSGGSACKRRRLQRGTTAAAVPLEGLVSPGRLRAY